MGRRACSVLLVVVLGQLLLAATSASAHSDLVGAAPAARSVSAAAVTTVELTFGSELRPGLAHVVVSSSGRADHVVGAPAVLGSRLVAQVDGVSSVGAYEVRYRVVAADGHPVTGSYRFRVGPTSSAGDETAAQPVATAAPAVAAGPGGPWEDAGLLVVLLGAGVVLVFSLLRRTRGGVHPGTTTEGRDA
jgi:methionine-rich copper-binding protein CopC